jgi:hypothetical protein
MGMPDRETRGVRIARRRAAVVAQTPCYRLLRIHLSITRAGFALAAVTLPRATPGTTRSWSRRSEGPLNALSRIIRGHLGRRSRHRAGWQQFLGIIGLFLSDRGRCRARRFAGRNVGRRRIAPVGVVTVVVPVTVGLDDIAADRALRIRTIPV